MGELKVVFDWRLNVFNTYKIQFLTIKNGFPQYDIDSIEADSCSEAMTICRNRYPGCRQIKRVWIEHPATWDELEILE